MTVTKTLHQEESTAPAATRATPDDPKAVYRNCLARVAELGVRLNRAYRELIEIGEAIETTSGMVPYRDIEAWRRLHNALESLPLNEVPAVEECMVDMLDGKARPPSAHRAA